MDNRYNCPQLLALMTTEWNLCGGGTCKANRIGYPMDMLKLSNSDTRGHYVRVVDPRLGMVATWWKDSKIVQTVSTIMKKGETVIKRQV